MRILKLTTAALMLTAAPALAETTLKMQTIAPSLGQAITMATFANIVSDKLDDVSIEVAGGGAATLHMMEVARGNLDMSMTSPTVYALMAGGKAMYANEPEAPELAKNLQLLMWFPYGQYHYAVRGDSDIEFIDDIEGASVFLGPQGGGAYNTARRWIETTTGLVAGEDYEAITANWQTGYQAFLDGKVDMYVNGCLDPCDQFIQFTETESIRFIQPEVVEGEHVDKFMGAFSFLDAIPAGVYQNQTNESEVYSHNTAVGIGVRADLDEDTVYRVTKAFWDNLDEVTSGAPWAEALDINYAVDNLGLISIHPGAARYYREVGVLE